MKGSADIAGIDRGGDEFCREDDAVTRLALSAGRGDPDALEQFVKSTRRDVWRLIAYLADVGSDSRRLEFFIRVYPDGEFSSYIARHASHGEQVTLVGPRGKFILRDNDRTPVLIFGNTNVGDVFGADELKELTEEMPHLEVISGVLHPDDSWTGEVGTATEIAQHYISGTDSSQFEYYCCGPPKMIEATTQMLEAAGVARDLRHHEDFVPSKMEEDNG